jgi:hypothetical protein
MSSVSQLGQKVCHFFQDNLCQNRRVFLTTLDVCSQKSSGHKAVNFDLNFDFVTENK